MIIYIFDICVEKASNICGLTLFVSYLHPKNMQPSLYVKSHQPHPSLEISGVLGSRPGSHKIFGPGFNMSNR